MRRAEQGFEHFEAWRDKVWDEEDSARHKLDRKIKAEARWAVEGISARRKRNQGRVRALQQLRADRAAMIRRQGAADMALDAGPKSGKRVIEARGMIEVSLGDFVMTGGEIAAMALIDATVRLIPRVLGNAESVAEESFSHGLLEAPHYTKPPVWEGREIPEVLLSGHHARISRWRREQAERLTKERRPDLWRALREGGPDPAGGPERSVAHESADTRPEKE